MPRLLRIKQFYERKQKDKAQNAIAEGYIQLFLGNWTAGYKFLTKGLAAEDANIVNYLAASYAAFKGGKSGNWLRHLGDAERKFPSHKFTIELVKAQFLFETDQFDEAKVILENLRQNKIYDSRLLLLLEDYYLKIEEWPALEALLLRLEKNSLIKPDELDELKIKCVKSEIAKLFVKNHSESNKESINALMALWKKTPDKVCEDVELIKFYTNALIRFSANQKGLKVVEKAIAKKWNDRLVRFYGESDFGENSHQLVIAEKWLKTKADSSVLFLTLARISLRNEFTEKAKNYYKSSIDLSPSAEAYLELSILLDREGDEDGSRENLKCYYKLIGIDSLNLPLVSYEI